MRTTVSLAEFADTACFLSCKRCSELVQENDRFCRFCGFDQFDTAGDAMPDVDADFVDTVQPEEPSSLAHVAAAHAANDRPNAFWQTRLREGSGPPRRARTSVVAFRQAIGKVSLSVRLALAVGRNIDLDKLVATVAQMQSALARGDVGSAELALGIVDAGEAFDRRTQARQAQPRQDNAVEVSMALGLGEPAARPAQVDVPPAAPMVAAPAPEIGAAPKQKPDECSDALAALAMCSKP